MSLKLGWATHQAAAHACENWHYSKILPTGKIVKIGAWEKGRFIGVVLFSRGASPHLGTKFELAQTEICELTRVALTNHETEVSRIVSISIKFLKKHCPGTKLIISFADPAQGHVGGIYKAGNWIYSGTSDETTEFLVRGRWRHVRGVYAIVQGREDKFKSRTRPGKHRYLMPLDEFTRTKILSFRQPYPKTKIALEAEASMRPDSIREIGGSSPTRALHSPPANQAQCTETNV